MDDRNIVRAVLFSAAVNILIEEGRAFKIITGTADFEAIKKYEKTILERAGSMVDDMVDAADIHDEDCECEEEETEEKPEVELKEVSFDSLQDLQRAVEQATEIKVRMEVGGECRACKQKLMGREAMFKHINTCEEIKKKRAGS